MSIFTDLFSTDAANKAAAAKKAGLTAGYDQASGLYDTGRLAVQQNYDKALGAYGGLGDVAGRSFDLAGDINGANGPEGNARARAIFQTDPGYAFARDEALQGVERSGAGRGMLMSGNTLTALAVVGGCGFAISAGSQSSRRTRSFIASRTPACSSGSARPLSTMPVTRSTNCCSGSMGIC